MAEKPSKETSRALLRLTLNENDMRIEQLKKFQPDEVKSKGMTKAMREQARFGYDGEM